MKWLVTILTAMFAGAKLAHAISWSWWLVFSPVIIYWGGCLVIMILAALVVGVGWLVNYGEDLNKHESSKR